MQKTAGQGTAGAACSNALADRSYGRARQLEQHTARMVIASLVIALILVILSSGLARGEGVAYEDLIPAEDENYSVACPWRTSNIRYGFDNGTADIAGSAEHQTQAEGMVLWSTVSAVTFRSEERVADVLIGWYTGSHGDGSAFDGVNGILAHAFFPCAPSHAGDIHFDDAETWTTSTRATWTQPMDLYTVSAHETGHALGLQHSSDSDSVMGNTYFGSHRYLGWDDIAGIQSLYGWSTGLYHLRDTNASGAPDRNFRYQALSDKQVVGDWDGDGDDTAGTFRPSDLKFYLRNSNGEGSTDITPYVDGSAEYTPIAGDWNGDGRDTTGFWRPYNASFAMRNTTSEGRAEIIFSFGGTREVAVGNALPVVGDWNADGRATIGIFQN